VSASHGQGVIPVRLPNPFLAAYWATLLLLFAVGLVVAFR